jgi:ribosomal protein S18 acetylase RimI-like enzyme
VNPPCLAIEALNASHQRAGFFCGSLPLDRYLLQQASQDVRRHIAAVFVLVREDQSIGGYYTLSSTSIPLVGFPEDFSRKLPKYKHMPATLLGRLAVSKECRGLGYGEFLLLDALRRCLRQSREIASLIVVVDAKDDAACSFYERYRFLRFPDSPHRFFLPMDTIKALLGM